MIARPESLELRRITYRSHNHDILRKQHRLLLPEVTLREETEHEVRQQRTVDTDTQPAQPVADQKGVDVIQTQLREVLVAEPEGERDEDTDGKGDGDHVVCAAGGEDLAGCAAPCDGLGVVVLHVLAGPDVGGLAEENVALVLDDGVHHDPVQDGADDGAEDLGGKSGARWELGVLGQLEILKHEQTLDHGVGGVESEHHVGDLEEC